MSEVILQPSAFTSCLWKMGGQGFLSFKRSKAFPVRAYGGIFVQCNSFKNLDGFYSSLCCEVCCVHTQSAFLMKFSTLLYFFPFLSPCLALSKQTVAITLM
jgi:hypothetical protein